MNADINVSDEELVKLTLKDKERFGSLVERYEAKLLRYIKRLTGLQDEHAEDVLQEIFIKIFRNLNNFDPDLKFSSWAYRITHNEAINHLRKYKGKETVALESDDENVANLIDILESDTDIKTETIKKETAMHVRKVLNELPKKYRDVLVLYYLEGKDYTEISDILKKPIGTISTLLHRAKQKFKDKARQHNIVT